MARTERHDSTWKCGSGRKRRNNRRLRQETRRSFQQGEYTETPDPRHYQESHKAKESEVGR